MRPVEAQCIQVPSHLLYMWLHVCWVLLGGACITELLSCRRWGLCYTRSATLPGCVSTAPPAWESGWGQLVVIQLWPTCQYFRGHWCDSVFFFLVNREGERWYGCTVGSTTGLLVQILPHSVCLFWVCSGYFVSSHSTKTVKIHLRA